MKEIESGGRGGMSKHDQHRHQKTVQRENGVVLDLS